MLLRKMGIQDAAGDLRDERGIAREGEADRLGESAGDAAAPQLGDRRRGAGMPGGDFGWPGKLPDAVGSQMPKGIVPRPFRARGVELLISLCPLALGLTPFKVREN